MLGRFTLHGSDMLSDVLALRRQGGFTYWIMQSAGDTNSGMMDIVCCLCERENA